jgi:hypothetical protein
MAYRLPTSNNFTHSISGHTIKDNNLVIGQKLINKAINNPSLKEAVEEADWTTDTPMSNMLPG